MIKLIKKRWVIVSCSTLLVTVLGFLYIIFFYEKSPKDMVVLHPALYGGVENFIRYNYEEMYKLYRKDGMSYDQACKNARSSLRYIMQNELNYKSSIPSNRQTTGVHIYPILDNTISLGEYEKNCLIEAVANNYSVIGSADWYNNGEGTPPWRWFTDCKYVYNGTLFKYWHNVYMKAHVLFESFVEHSYVIKYLQAKGINNPKRVIKALGDHLGAGLIRLFIHSVQTTTNPNGFDTESPPRTQGFDFSHIDLNRFIFLENMLYEGFSTIHKKLLSDLVSDKKCQEEEQKFLEGIINTCSPGRVVYRDPTNRKLKHIHPVFKGDGLNITDSDKKLLLEYIANNVYILSEGPQWNHKRYTIAESFVDYDDLVKYLTKNWTLKHAENVIKHTIGEDSLLIGADDQGVVFYKKIIFYVKYNNKAF